MRLKLFAISAGLLASAGTYAQSSVTLYGVADIGVEYLNSVPNAAKASSSLLALQSGNQSGSRWGIRGVEDLGGGLKGIFTVESGFTIDDGKMAQGARLFGRAAFVGLQSRWGQLTLGRHATPFWDFAGAFDPMGNAGRFAIGAQDPFMLSQRADNSARYIGTFGALTVTGLYSFNYNNTEVPGNFTNGREYSLMAVYAAGPFSVGAVYDQTNQSSATALTSNQLIRRAAVAGTYALGPAKLYAGYRYARSYNGASLPGAGGAANTYSNLAWAGLGYQLTPSVSLTGAAYYQNLRYAHVGNPWQFVATADYSLSKRTDLYTSMSYALNSNTRSALGVNGFNDVLGASSSEQVVPGKNQFGAVLGIRHKF
ncbi:porin [Cupriavidus lacunae]|uniref:Porin n=1 Tax=Cupriavidus lacunae TaxID=2666307 RepID=A0A370P0H5_9BURK|nr:porin [Cupriavidus lacunae]RDK11360.1 porin [Cupriavidus lacunae]